jgi:hypothetical protein
MPPGRESALFDRASRACNGIVHPSSQDMLAHLIIHAVCSHWLDSGPAVLVDIDFLLQSSPPE